MSNRFNRGLATNAKTEKMLVGMPVVMTDWYYNLTAAGKSPNTCKEYIRSAKKFVEFCEENGSTLEKVNEPIVARYMISIRTKQNKSGEITETSDSYKQTVWSALNSLIGYMYKRGDIPKNYMDAIERPSKHDKVKRYYLTQDDFKRILDCIKKEGNKVSDKPYARKVVSRNLLIMSLFMATGMRKTALSDIDVSDIDMQLGTLRVVDKREEEHIYFLEPGVRRMLNEWLEDRKYLLDGEESDALFITNKRTRLSESTVYDIVKKYTEMGLGYAISPHKLRAGFCTILYEKTKDIKFVSKAVGHKDISTTQLYVQTDNKDRIKAAKMMEGIFE